MVNCFCVKEDGITGARAGELAEFMAEVVIIAGRFCVKCLKEQIALL